MLPAASSSLRAASFSSRRTCVGELFELLLQVGRPSRPSRPCAGASACASRRAGARPARGRSRPTRSAFCSLRELRRPDAARPACRARRGRPDCASSCLLRLSQRDQRAPLRLRAAVARSVGRRSLHRVRGVLQLRRIASFRSCRCCSRVSCSQLPRGFSRASSASCTLQLVAAAAPPLLARLRHAGADAPFPAAAAAPAPSASRPARRPAGRSACCSLARCCISY